MSIDNTERFTQVASHVAVSRAREQLLQLPELWDQHPERRLAHQSPHAEMTDIWLRFRPRDEMYGPEAYREAFVPAFYPAWWKLTELHPVVYWLLARVRAVQLGGILITKMPPGAVIRPHHDRGSWHAEFFSTKLYVPLQTNSGCLNFCGPTGTEDVVCMREGSVWTFDNLVPHSVVNRGTADRIMLIVCTRVELGDN